MPIIPIMDKEIFLPADDFFESQSPVGLTFDDISLATRFSDVLPNDANLETNLSEKIKLNLPILSSDMDTVTESEMAIAMALGGGMGIIHKNFSIEDQASQVNRVKKFASGIISDPVTVSPDITIREVLDITKFNNISGVPVVDNGITVGIVTNRDLRFETNLDGLVSSVMSSAIIWRKTNLKLPQTIFTVQRIRDAIFIN